MRALFAILLTYNCSRNSNGNTMSNARNGVMAMGMSSSSSSSSRSSSSSNNSCSDRDTLSGLSNQGGQGQLPLPSLVLIGDSELLTPCEPCEIAMLPNGDIQLQLSMLKRCQKTYGGIGIAACQDGWRTRIFCMGMDAEDTAARARYPNAPTFPHQFWINPIISTSTSLELETGTSWFWEGCLSVPGMRGWVERPNAIRIQGWNEHGQYVETELDGLAARVAQHEFDHLDGILFPDRALPGTLLPVKAFEEGRQDKWPNHWPTPGSRQTKPGGFSRIK